MAEWAGRARIVRLAEPSVSVVVQRNAGRAACAGDRGKVVCVVDVVLGGSRSAAAFYREVEDVADSVDR